MRRDGRSQGTAAGGAGTGLAATPLFKVEDPSMMSKFDQRDSIGALDPLQPATEAGAAVAPESPLPDTEWNKREALKVKMIAQRVKLKLMRDRTDELKQALERFRTQRNAMSA